MAAANALLAADSPGKMPSVTSTGCHAPAGPGAQTRLVVSHMGCRSGTSEGACCISAARAALHLVVPYALRMSMATKTRSGLTCALRR
eukprot:8911823-Alexandrium_andersonii.AAC.1